MHALYIVMPLYGLCPEPPPSTIVVMQSNMQRINIPLLSGPIKYVCRWPIALLKVNVWTGAEEVITKELSTKQHVNFTCKYSSHM